MFPFAPPNDDQPVNYKKTVHIKPSPTYDLSMDNVHPILINNGTHMSISIQ